MTFGRLARRLAAAYAIAATAMLIALWDLNPAIAIPFAIMYTATGAALSRAARRIRIREKGARSQHPAG